MGTATSLGPDTVAAVQAFEHNAVEEVLRDHGLPDSDYNAVLSSARGDVRAQEWVDLGLIISKRDPVLCQVFPSFCVGKQVRTQQDKLVYHWFNHLVQRQLIRATQAAINEYVRYSGLSKSTFDQPGNNPYPFGAQGSNTGWCNYSMPGPFASQYTGNQDPICFGPTHDAFSFLPPTPTIDQFEAIGEYDALIGALQDPALGGVAFETSSAMGADLGQIPPYMQGLGFTPSSFFTSLSAAEKNLPADGGQLLQNLGQIGSGFLQVPTRMGAIASPVDAENALATAVRHLTNSKANLGDLQSEIDTVTSLETEPEIASTPTALAEVEHTVTSLDGDEALVNEVSSLIDDLLQRSQALETEFAQTDLAADSDLETNVSDLLTEIDRVTSDSSTLAGDLPDATSSLSKALQADATPSAGVTDEINSTISSVNDLGDALDGPVESNLGTVSSTASDLTAEATELTTPASSDLLELSTIETELSDASSGVADDIDSLLSAIDDLKTLETEPEVANTPAEVSDVKNLESTATSDVDQLNDLSQEIQDALTPAENLKTAEEQGSGSIQTETNDLETLSNDAATVAEDAQTAASNEQGLSDNLTTFSTDYESGISGTPAEGEVKTLMDGSQSRIQSLNESVETPLEQAETTASEVNPEGLTPEAQAEGLLSEATSPLDEALTPMESQLTQLEAEEAASPSADTEAEIGQTETAIADTTEATAETVETGAEIAEDVSTAARFLSVASEALDFIPVVGEVISAITTTVTSAIEINRELALPGQLDDALSQAKTGEFKSLESLYVDPTGYLSLYATFLLGTTPEAHPGCTDGEIVVSGSVGGIGCANPPTPPAPSASDPLFKVQDKGSESFSETSSITATNPIDFADESVRLSGNGWFVIQKLNVANGKAGATIQSLQFPFVDWQGKAWIAERVWFGQGEGYRFALTSVGAGTTACADNCLTNTIHFTRPDGSHATASIVPAPPPPPPTVITNPTITGLQYPGSLVQGNQGSFSVSATDSNIDPSTGQPYPVTYYWDFSQGNVCVKVGNDPTCQSDGSHDLMTGSTVSETFIHPGSRPVTVTATDPAGGSTTQTFAVTVNPVTNVIHFSQPPDFTYSTPSFGTGATENLVTVATSGLPVTMTSQTPTVCDVIPAGTLTISQGTTNVPEVEALHPGTCTLQATQPGTPFQLNTLNIPAADPVTRSLQIAKPTTTIYLEQYPSPTQYSDRLPSDNLPMYSDLAGMESITGGELTCTRPSWLTDANGNVIVPAGFYPQYCSGLTSSTYNINYQGDIYIAPESATLSYTGTDSDTPGEAELSALVTQTDDGSAGDLTSAKVDFLLFAPGNSSSTPDYQKVGVAAASDGTVATTLTGLPGGDYRVVVKIDSQHGQYFTASDVSGSADVLPVGTATVTGVSSTLANGSYTVGQLVPVTVSFSNAVDVTGTPLLALSSGGTASYSSGSGTSTLTFTYTVGAGQNANPLDEASASALSLNGGTIQDTIGNDADLTLPAPGTSGALGVNKSIVIDTTSPTVTNVTSTTANGTYGVGAVVTVTVSFSKTVNVTGTPQLALNSGGTASYSSGSGTGTLAFTYTVAAGQNSSDLDYTSASALTLNGGAIQDTIGNAATLTLPSPGASGSLGANKAIVIDTTSPVVTGVSSTLANGSYTVGQIVPVTVTFNEPVTVTGTPLLALSSGGTASYSSGSGTSTLTFTYTVGAGQSASPLDEASASALSLNGGTIQDGAGNTANLALPAPGTSGALGVNKSIVIDTTSPTVTNVTSTTANGTYGVGAVVTVTVSFSKTVNVTGTPLLALNSGGTASYSSGSGTGTLVFTYTVAAGQNSSDLDYTSTSALTLNGGAIQDTIGNAATLTLPSPGASGSLGANKAIVIDTTSPVVTGVSSTLANGSYTVGQVVPVTVSFSKSVMVTGTPLLALSSGGTASYSSGSGTSTLTFTYTVGAGQSASPLDEASASALSQNGGTIQDGAGNTANLALPAPGTSGALGVNKDIVIVLDTTAPTITISTTANKAASGWYNIASSGTSGISIAVSATDPSGVSSLSCSDGATSVLNTTSSGSFTLHDGDHYISCSATDTVGNSGASTSSTGYHSGSPSTAKAEFKVDQTRPMISHATGTPTYGSSPLYVKSATGLTFTVADATSGVSTCSITVTAPGSQTYNPACGATGGTYSLNPALIGGGTPSDGVYGNVADATDVAGNSATENSFSVTLDNTAPAITITTPPSSDSSNPTVYSYGSVPNAGYSCSDGTGSGVAASGGCVGKVDTTTVNSGTALVGTVGKHTLSVTSKDNLNNASANPTNHYYDVQAATSVLYTGDESVTYPSAVNLTATLSSAAPTCSSGQSLTFTITDASNGTTVKTGTTNTSGGTGPLAVTLPEGVYTVEVSYNGVANQCLSSADEATVVVGAAGSKATGGGWTTVNGVGRVNFAFVVDQVSGTGTGPTNPAQYKGQYVLVKPNGWRFKGTFGNAVGGTYVVTTTSAGKTGSGTGTGSVYVWNGLSATFVPAAGGGSVTFSIGFGDNGSGGKKQTTPDQFANHDNYDPVANGYNTTLNPFPDFTVLAIKGGNITIS